MKQIDKWFFGPQLVKVARALELLKDAPLPHVVRYTGVPQKVIEKAAKLSNRESDLDDTNKPALLPKDFYDSIEPDEPIDEDDKADVSTRLFRALTRVQYECKHPRYFCRCSKCMKVVGSELNHFSIETMFHIMREAEYDLKDNDHDNEIRHEFALLVNDRMQRERLSRLEEEDEEPDGL